MLVSALDILEGLGEEELFPGFEPLCFMALIRSHPLPLFLLVLAAAACSPL